MRSILIAVSVAVAFFATGEALKCYECVSPTKDCADPFDKDGSGIRTVECPIEKMYCMKSIAQLSNKTTATGRTCWFASTTRAAERASDVSIVTVTQHFCNTDLCNGVSTTGATLSVLIVLVVPFIFARYH